VFGGASKSLAPALVKIDDSVGLGNETQQNEIYLPNTKYTVTLSTEI